MRIRTAYQLVGVCLSNSRCQARYALKIRGEMLVTVTGFSTVTG